MTEILVYLDLNHWIGLAKARTGHRDAGPYRPAYEALQRLTASGAVKTPLSGEHYFELSSRIRPLRQRNDVALTMAELSRFATLVSRDALLHSEFRTALANALDRPRSDAPPLNPIGHGVGFAFGQPRVGRLRGPGLDDPGRFDRAEELIDLVEDMIGDDWRFSGRGTALQGRELVEALFNEAAEFAVLRGPRPSDIEDLRENYAYRPETAEATLQRIAERERFIADGIRSDADLARRVEDVVSASTYAYDLNPTILPAVLDELGLTADSVLALGKDRMTKLLDDTPILDVEMALRRGNFKNGQYIIKSNDVFDMAALGVSVVCCDIVVTDRSAAHRLRAARADIRHSCRVLSTPAELVEALGAV